MAELINVSTKLTGKMEGMTVITTAMCNNPNCAKLSQINGAICQQCYSKIGLAWKKNVRESYIRNGEILSSGIIPKRELPFVNAQYCRFESHGDLINETHLENYLRICKHNPSTKFSLWTKMYKLCYKYFSTHKPPKNFTLIISSLMMNQPMTKMLERFKELGVRTRLFTVYDKEYIAEHPEVKINCGGNHCLSCLRCYKGRNEIVNELLKKDQKNH